MTSASVPGNVLYYGDNLHVLRRHVKGASVDLVYLDPPFKSNKDYNVLFAEPSGSRAAARIKAFEDTWRWDEAAREACDEVVQGKVCEVLRFGAFVRFGPLDGLLHISQIMDDRIDIDESNNRLVGKDTKRDLRTGDIERARIVAISINEVNYRESKIGLTMRQPGLGKLEWLEEDRKPDTGGGGKGKKKGRRGK